MEKICFIISPMGDDPSPVRSRADYVLKTYLEPACLAMGYRAVRADQQEVRNIVTGITTALQNAPMAIAYMGAPVCGASGCGGAPFWNANVMIEIGIRLASHLPLIFVSDRDVLGRMPNYPLSLSNLNVILLPGNNTAATPHDWIDQNPGTTIQKLRSKIEAAQRQDQWLDCEHPLALINASCRDNNDPDHLLYTAASYAAHELFGVKDDDPTVTPSKKRRLVGRNMIQYMQGVKERMHPTQWKMFDRDQRQARESLKNNEAAVANVPIVFETHEQGGLNLRAYLPIIVQQFKPASADDNDWYNLRVLYLNVTTVTRKVTLPNGEEYYECGLDPLHGGRLEPLKPYAGIKVFISYARRNYQKVEPLLEMLKRLEPYVDPFIDLGIEAGQIGIDELQTHLDEAELFFVFFDASEMGPGQAGEVRALIDRQMAGKALKIVPVLLEDSAKVPSFLHSNQWLKYGELTHLRLKKLFIAHFADRCPDDWERSPAPPPLAAVPSHA